MSECFGVCWSRVILITNEWQCKWTNSLASPTQQRGCTSSRTGPPVPARRARPRTLPIPPPLRFRCCGLQEKTIHLRKQRRRRLPNLLESSDESLLVLQDNRRGVEGTEACTKSRCNTIAAP